MINKARGRVLESVHDWPAGPDMKADNMAQYHELRVLSGIQHEYSRETLKVATVVTMEHCVDQTKVDATNRFHWTST